MPFKKVYFKKQKPGGSARWDDTKRVEIIQTYILLGVLNQAAATCNVPIPTAKAWKATQWWKDMEADLRRAAKIQLSAKLSDVVHKSIAALDDRVTNGDYIYNPKTKDFTRRPISAEHANRIVATQIDRMQVLEKAATKDTTDDVGIAARLEKLKQDLIKGFSKPALAQRVIQGEVVEASFKPSSDSGSDSGDLACNPAIPDLRPTLSEEPIYEDRILNGNNPRTNPGNSGLA